MNYLLIPAVLAAFCPVADGNGGDCDTSKCITDLEAVLKEDPFDCRHGPQRIINALEPCKKPECSQEERAKISPYGRVIEEKMALSNCSSSAPKSATARACSFAETFTCITGSANFITLIPNLQIDDISKLCVDISTILSTVHICEKCLETVIPGFEAWTAEVQNIFDITITLLNGGCNCTRMLVGILNSLDLASECSRFKLLANFAKTLASDCAIKLVNYPLKLEWLTYVDNYINFFFPFFTPFICGSAAHYGNLQLLTASLLFLLLMRRMNK